MRFALILVVILLAISLALSRGMRLRPHGACDRAYPDWCIPSPPPDLDCRDVHGRKPFRVLPPDPHHFDRDGDGRACEPLPRRRRG